MYKILANTLFLGKDIIYLTDCHSTNDEAHDRLRKREVAEGSVVITDNQTKGKGQRGNQWHSEKGKNLTFSLVLQPRFLSPSEQFFLNIVISLSILDFFSDYIQDIRIKWPNDIVHITDGKLGGILIENFISQSALESSIVGIGLNINQRDFSVSNACSLAQLAGQDFDKWELLRGLIKHIENRYIQFRKVKRELLREEYLLKLFRFNEWSDFEDEEIFRGRIKGITEEGKLVIEKENGHFQHYAFKEVKFLFGN
ncbi:biotin--[acetyl-CoA-carboxylase] ligase [Aquiflexum lacus]|uniref:biotin--[acetyl-CoA-carboxylase] ligase n=1 Tax=Aquiflexum lacus TaxID=2483805 RepID=UPI001894B18B|nr:biotin--[acetyl-CoA-carboxylase] ligase [Aquiflexum lacus]